MFEKIANTLQQEAQDLLHNKGLWQTLLSKGNIHVTGSSYLDLLVFPDLDVYFEAQNSNDVIDVFADTAKSFIKNKDVTSVELEKELYKRYTQVPKGIVLQCRFNNGHRLWKIDIWAIEDPQVLTKNMQEMQAFKNQLTSKQREIILEAKHTLAKPFGRTPVGSSYLVYKAVLEEGINDVGQIITWIRNQGGNVDKLK